MISVFLAFASMVSYITMTIMSFRRKATITAACPEYAARLFNSAADVAVLKLLPIRWDTLFFTASPAPIKGPIVRLRIMYLCHALLIAAFLLSMLASLL